MKTLFRQFGIILFSLLFFTCIYVMDGNAETIFSWNVEESGYKAGSTFNNSIKKPFVDINGYANAIKTISNKYSHSGSQSVEIGYPNDEAGATFKINFPETPTLFTRKYEYFAPGWEGNWPVGLKTSRYFTIGTDPSCSSRGWVYHSEKMIFQSYSSTCNEQYGMGMNSAIMNLDLKTNYPADVIFGNGHPYIRTGHWYKIETWMVMNSADGVADGVLKIWIDDKTVYSNSAVKWKGSARGASCGTGWTTMWFGGNYSGAICGGPNKTVYRYIDDFYLSTTNDRTVPESTHP